MIAESRCLELRKPEFETLFIENRQRLFRYAQRICAQYGLDADDIFQEACLRGYRYYDTFEFRANFRTWMCRIIVTTSLDALRKKRAAPQTISYDIVVETDEGETSAQIGMDDPHLDIKRLDFVHNVFPAFERVLARSPEHLRQAFVLYELEELAYTEIAEQLALPIGTVKSRLNRARSYIKDELTKTLRAKAPK